MFRGWCLGKGRNAGQLFLQLGLAPWLCLISLFSPAARCNGNWGKNVPKYFPRSPGMTQSDSGFKISQFPPDPSNMPLPVSLIFSFFGQKLVEGMPLILPHTYHFSPTTQWHGHTASRYLFTSLEFETRYLVVSVHCFSKCVQGTSITSNTWEITGKANFLGPIPGLRIRSKPSG